MFASPFLGLKHSILVAYTDNELTNEVGGYEHVVVLIITRTTTLFYFPSDISSNLYKLKRFCLLQASSDYSCFC